jgi:GTP-binding protein
MIVKIKDARYAGTIFDKLEELPEYAFAGRSNVGKSTLINALLGRRSLVRTSKQPGKTRNINYFKVDMVDLPSIYMVDLPGYGYAKVSRDMKDSWGKLAQRYFHENKNLKLIILLVDIRRDLKDEEFMVLNLAKSTGAQSVLIATKSDKLGSNKRLKRLSEIKKQCGLQPIMNSSMTREGIEALWMTILENIKH